MTNLTISDIASIIAIVLFIPVVMVSISRPKDGFVYEKDLTRMTSVVVDFFGFLFLILFMTFFGAICAMGFNQYWPTVHADTILPWVQVLGAIGLLVKSVRTALFGIRTNRREYAIFNLYFAMIPFVAFAAIETIYQNNLSIIICVIAFILILAGHIDRFHIGKKVIWDRNSSSTELSREQVLTQRQKYKTMIVMSIIFTSAVSGFALTYFGFDSGSVGEMKEKLAVVIFGCVLIAIAESVIMVVFKTYNLVHDYCFHKKESDEMFFLESVSDSVVRLHLRKSISDLSDGKPSIVDKKRKIIRESLDEFLKYEIEDNDKPINKFL